MIKPTPNPPETASVSPYESIDSKKLHEAADRALDHYLCPPGSTPPPRKHRGMYAVTADNKTEELLVDASETLASAKTLAEHCQFVAGVAASRAGGDCAVDYARGVGGESGFG